MISDIQFVLIVLAIPMAYLLWMHLYKKILIKENKIDFDNKHKEKMKLPNDNQSLLRLERERFGLSIAELAKIGEISEELQYEYENQIEKPDSDYLIKLAMYGFDVRYILIGKHTVIPTMGEKLKQERERLKLSVDAMATAGGVTHEEQVKFENGTLEMTFDYLVKIAETKIDIGYILTGVRVQYKEGFKKSKEDFNQCVLDIKAYVGNSENFTNKKLIELVINRYKFIRDNGLTNTKAVI